uniref:FLYWCH-type domain-containing protein n=1 Tax=Anopheles atroparvus TaxID=41427 RepID=A0A182IKF0_ANOAO
MIDNPDVTIVDTPTGSQQLVYQNYTYHRNISTATCQYWRCSKAARLKCKATIVTDGMTMRINCNGHNHVPMRRLIYGLGVDRKPIFIAISAKKQLIKLRDKLYRKTIGRAYRSYWMCIEYGCPGELMLQELRGGTITITSAHNDDCTSDYFKNRPPEQWLLTQTELTRLEQSLVDDSFEPTVAAISILDRSAQR